MYLIGLVHPFVVIRQGGELGIEVVPKRLDIGDVVFVRMADDHLVQMELAIGSIDGAWLPFFSFRVR